MRMAPLHTKRKFWWELLFISVLVFLLAGVRSQRKLEVAAAVPAVAVPTIAIAAIVKPLPALALK